MHGAPSGGTLLARRQEVHDAEDGEQAIDMLDRGHPHAPRGGPARDRCALLEEDGGLERVRGELRHPMRHALRRGAGAVHSCAEGAHLTIDVIALGLEAAKCSPENRRDVYRHRGSRLRRWISFAKGRRGSDEPASSRHVS